jgi:AcrR family transcriptional regulator
MRHEAHSPARPGRLPCVQFERPFGRRFGVAIGERYAGILEAARGVFARRGYHQASIREIARAAHLSLAGLYHYVGGKDELLFLVLDRALDTLLQRLDAALAEAGTPRARLAALIRTHLEFGWAEADALRIVNRDWEALEGPRRTEVAARRRQYMERGLEILRELDPYGRSAGELFSATNLLLGMLNGIATRSFVRSAEDAGALAEEVGTLFLHGFLGHGEALVPAAAIGGGHDA